MFSFAPAHSSADLEPGSHLCWLYETDEEYRAGIVPAIRRGLERGEKVIYTAPARLCRTVLEYLQDDGLDTESYLGKGVLVIRSCGESGQRKPSAPDALIAQLQTGTERALAQGYTGLRVIEEMTWVLAQFPGVDWLTTCEAGLNEFLPGTQCSVICQYDRRHFDPDVLLHILRTHPIAIVGTQVYDNFYYIPFQDLLANDPPGQKLGRWLKNLADHARTEEAEREQRALSEALRDIAATLNSTLDLDEVLEQILANLSRVGPHDAATIMLIENGIARSVRAYGYAEHGLSEAALGPQLPVHDTPSLRQIAETGGTLVIPDVQNWSSWSNITPWIRSCIAAPIRLGEEIIGFICLDSATPGAFDATDGERLRAFADHAAIALRNARLYGESQAHNRRLALLNQITKIGTATLDLDELLQQLVDSAAEVVGGNGCYITLWDARRNRPIPAAAYGPERDTYCAEMSQLDNVTLTEHVLKAGHPLVIEDVSNSPYLCPKLAKNYLLASILILPLQADGRDLGALLITFEELHHFTDDEIAWAEQAGELIALAIAKSQVYTDLEQRVAERTAELSTARKRVEAILNSSPDAILFLGEDGTIQTGNGAFFELFGYRASEGYGQPLTRLTEAADVEKLRQSLSDVTTKGTSPRFEIAAQRKDGTTFDADVALAPVREDGVVTGVVCSIRDITALREVDRLKDAFVANVSHGLRTPIANLKLYHHLLNVRPEKRETYMATLQRETDRLERIVEDLLYLSRMDRGQIIPRPTSVDLNALAGQYVLDRMRLAENQGLSLTFAEGADLPTVEADEELLGRALGILLTNAFDYTPDGGQVKVSVQVDRSDGVSWVGLRVSDTGAGIPPDEQARLFERFFRGVAAYKFGVPGAGLGLAIVREIVDRHGGRVEVVSGGTQGEGTMFTIWLPAGGADSSE